MNIFLKSLHEKSNTFQPQDTSDLRKISCTTDYSKLFEGFLKDCVMTDISDNIDIDQFGGKIGIGIVRLPDPWNSVI